MAQISQKFHLLGPPFEPNNYLWGLLFFLFTVFHVLWQLKNHEDCIDYGLEASSPNYGQLGPTLAIPIPKFGHRILVALGIAALDSIFTLSRLIMLETWMEIIKIIHNFGFLLMLTQILMKIMMMMLPGLQYALIMAHSTHTA